MLVIYKKFSYSDIPPDVLTFTVTVLNKGKRAKDSEVAEITIDLSSLANGEEVRIKRKHCFKMITFVSSFSYQSSN